jgi:hypothetical protein
VAIALNVTRTRITVLGFALALYLFSIGILLQLAQSRGVPAAWVFLTSMVPLSVGFSLAAAAMLLLVVSQRLDAVGSCEIWTFSFGELLTYAAMAQTLSGGLQYLFTAITSPALLDSVLQGLDASTIADVRALSGELSGWLIFIVGAIWFTLMYVAPAAFIVRTPLPRKRKWVLGVAYALILTVVSVPAAYAYRIHARVAGDEGSFAGTLVRQLWQPAMWGPPDELILKGWQAPSESPR